MDYNTFAGRLKNTDFSVIRQNISYNHSDTRCWTAIVNKDTDNIIVTYNANRYDLGTQYFDIFSSNKILADVEVEDVFDVIEQIVSRSKTLVNQPQELTEFNV